MAIPTTGRIGDILIQRGLVTQAQLDYAAEVARDSGVRIGEALVQIGAIDADHLQWALAVQFDMSYVDLKPEMVDFNLLASMPLDRLRELYVLPIAMVDETIHAVIADPTAAGLWESLAEIFTARPMVIQQAHPDDILRILDQAETIRREAVLGDTERNAPENYVMTRWFPKLECGELDRVVIHPDVTGDGRCSVAIVPAGESEPLTLPDHDVAYAIRQLRNLQAHSGFIPSAPFVLRPGNPSMGLNAMRIGMVPCATGWLLTMESLFAGAPQVANVRTMVLGGASPTALKTAVLNELARVYTNESAPAVVLEQHVDFISGGCVQIEVAGESERLSLCRQLLEVVHPRILLIEIEDAESLLRLPCEACGLEETLLVVLLKTRWRGEEFVHVAEDVDLRLMPALDFELKGAVDGLFGGGA